MPGMPDPIPGDTSVPNRAVSPPATAATAHQDAPEAAIRLLALARASRRIVAFTGAGISTESGIPDYRGPDGVWAKQTPPTLDDFLTNPATRRTYWERRREGYPRLAAAEPNAGHAALVDLERAGRLHTVVTQNIDGLHQKAGQNPDRVIELHGTAHTVRCLDCGRVWPASEVQARLDLASEPPACEVCGGALRAGTVLFGEPLPAAALRRAAEAARSCDLMLVVGTSLVVNPAAQVPVLAKQHGARLAYINREPTPLDHLADVLVTSDAGPTLAALVAGLA